MSKKLTDAKRKAIKKYAENHMKQINLKLNVKTDADILEWLQSQESIQGYIKQLIREDMEGKPSATPIIERTVTPEGVLNLWQCGKCQTYIGTYLSKCPFCRTPIDWESVKHKLK